MNTGKHKEQETQRYSNGKYKVHNYCTVRQNLQYLHGTNKGHPENSSNSQKEKLLYKHANGILPLSYTNIQVHNPIHMHILLPL